MIRRIKNEEWETKNSSLAKTKTDATYEECRTYACEDIAKLTYIPEDIPFIMEIPKGVEFHFIGRVDTEIICKNNARLYYYAFKNRDFISFSTICNKNVSHYKGKVFFVYNILPEEIVHIFPMDSDTKTAAKYEADLTRFPSFWITLKELESLTAELGVYNQVTCKTKRNGQVIKPLAVIAFDKADEELLEIAKQFGIGLIIVHPDEKAINYNKDLLKDDSKLKSVSEIMNEKFNINVVNTVVFHS